MRLAVISDSHIPEREAEIPEPFRERIAAADHTIHAGDFEMPAVLRDVQELATGLTAVHGNVDPDEVALPAVDAVELGGVTFVVTHSTINPVTAAANATHVATEMELNDDHEVVGFSTTIESESGLTLTDEDWLRAIADTARARTRSWDGEGVVGIGGHSHEVADETFEGVRVLNPGSVTGADPAETATMMTVDVEEEDFEVHLHEA